MLRITQLVVFAFVLSAIGASAGCRSEARSAFDVRTPRFYLWTHFEPKEVRDSIQVNGLSVEEAGKGGFVVRGTGTLKWVGGSISVSENSVTVNGVTLLSESDSYGTAFIEKDGRVIPNVNPPFEWPVYKLW